MKLRRVLVCTALVAGLGALGQAHSASAAEAAVEPAAPPTPHLDAVEEKLRVLAPGLEAKVWNRTDDNALGGDAGSGDWILQTPDCWGQVDCTDPAGFSRFLSAIHDDLASAEQVVDITTLDPMPDGEFLAAVISGLRDGYAAGRRPLIRVLDGKPPLLSFFYPNAWRTRDKIVAGVGPQTRLAVTRTRTDLLGSWNHAKIVAVDGRSLITGGHNMWAANYLQTNDPVHDLSVHLRGPVAVDAHRFVDIEWSYACTHANNLLAAEVARTTAAAGCPSQAAPAVAPTGTGSIPILSVGRLGVGLYTAGIGGVPDPVPAYATDGRCLFFWPQPFNESAGYTVSQPADVALRALAASATSEIRISQQDVMGFCPATAKYDVRLFDILALKMLAGVDVRIVTSTPGANWDVVNQYSNVSSLQATSQGLLQRLTRVTGDPVAARAALCAHLQLAHLRPGPFEHWPNGHLFANHAKLIWVDDAAAYVGSDNLYPASIQDWGVMMEGPEPVASLTQHYLDPLWEWSRSTASVDPEQGRCDA